MAMAEIVGPIPQPGLDELVILTLFGRVNVGKSSICNALLRRDLAKVDPRSGWTREITIYQVSRQLAVADTPGLDDPNPAIGDAAFNFVGDTDVFLHVHNLVEGVGHPARAALAKLRETGLPVAVVLNKSDLVAAAGRAAAEREAVEKLGADGVPVFVTSALSGDGLQGLADWIDAQVKGKGDALAWARVCRRALPILEEQLEREVAECILNHSLVAGGIGAIPLPIVDLPLLLGTQIRLAHALGRIYGIEVNPSRLKELVGLIAGGFALRQVARQALKLVPWFGWAVSSGIAFGGTYGLGKALALYYRTGMRADAAELRRIYRAELEQAKVRFQRDPELRRRAEEERRRRAQGSGREEGGTEGGNRRESDFK